MKPSPASALSRLHRTTAASLASLLAFATATGINATADAQADRIINYQGVVELTNGQSLGPTVTGQFFLHRSATGGSFIDEVIRTGIPVSDDGLFSVELDFGDTDRNGNPLYNNEDLFLEVWINSVPLTPRQRIAAVPMAMSIPGAFSTENQLFLGSGISNISIGDGALNTDVSLLRGSLSINSTSHFAAFVESNSTIGTWLNLNNTSAGGGNWAMISAGDANGEGPGSFVISDQSVGAARMVIDPQGNVGFGTASPTERLDIAGAIRIRGADIVEGFDSSSGDIIEPGTVVSIDPTPGREGRLMPSTDAYDTKVAGVVSGAGGLPYGMSLAYDGQFDGETKVAMTGRVYVKCSAEAGTIKPGDLLTTAALEGHAMKATDRDRAHGTVIGKAMSTLQGETGLVLVLVNLQ